VCVCVCVCVTHTLSRLCVWQRERERERERERMCAYVNTHTHIHTQGWHTECISNEFCRYSSSSEMGSGEVPFFFRLFSLFVSCRTKVALKCDRMCVKQGLLMCCYFVANVLLMCMYMYVCQARTYVCVCMYVTHSTACMWRTARALNQGVWNDLV
jgi:hypothetical protein